MGRQFRGVSLHSCICRSCGNIYDVHHISEFNYGVRLVFTEDGKFEAYLNCFEDTVFNEVKLLVDKHFRDNPKWKQSQNRVDFFNKIFNATCDPINGTLIDISRVKRACKNCGSEDLLIDTISSISNSSIILPIVSHRKWGLLSRKEKEQYVFDMLKNDKLL